MSKISFRINDTGGQKKKTLENALIILNNSLTFYIYFKKWIILVFFFFQTRVYRRKLRTHVVGLWIDVNQTRWSRKWNSWDLCNVLSRLSRKTLRNPAPADSNGCRRRFQTVEGCVCSVRIHVWLKSLTAAKLTINWIHPEFIRFRAHVCSEAQLCKYSQSIV